VFTGVLEHIYIFGREGDIGEEELTTRANEIIWGEKERR
jgi:hypothetical protein